MDVNLSSAFLLSVLEGSVEVSSAYHPAAAGLCRAGMSVVPGVWELPPVGKLGVITGELFWVLLDLWSMLFPVFRVKPGLGMRLHLGNQTPTVTHQRQT